MAAFELLANLVQTIHVPPNSFVLWSDVRNDSWQLRLFLISSDISCLVSTKREEISRDRKLVAGDKEGAFKDWKALAKFINEKIVNGHLHIAEWTGPQVNLVIDPGRPSSLTIPLSVLPAAEAASTITDFIYLVANDARKNRACHLTSNATDLVATNSKPSTVRPKQSLPAVREAALEAEVARLKSELEEKGQALQRAQENTKAEGSRAPVAPPKVVPGDSRAKPGQRHRVIKRAEFEDDDNDQEGHVETTHKAPRPTARSKVLPSSKAKRVVTRPEFDDSEGDENEKRTQQSSHSFQRPTHSQLPSTSKLGARSKRAVKRSEFEDSDDEETAEDSRKRQKV